MAMTHSSENLQSSSPGRGRRPHAAAGSLAAALLALAMGCEAPGMKLEVSARNRPTTTEMNGLKVTLRRLDPQAVASQSAPAEAPASLADLASDKLKPYVIGPQDILSITVWDHPEITLPMGQYRSDNATGNLVEDDGRMYFPYVGKVQVGGLTISEARARLTTELAKVLRNPQVDVRILAFRSQKIYVGGDVHLPGAYNVTDVPLTLNEAINRAGGFLPTADDGDVILSRGGRTWHLNFPALMAQGELSQKIILKDGDTLLVPNDLETPVYMMGEVIKPGTLPLIHGRLSLAKAISDVGGINGLTSDARSIYVLRPGAAADAVDVFHLDARNPTAMVLADRFALRPKDFVYVDAGSLVRFNKVMTLLLPIYDVTINSAQTYYLIKTANK